MLTKLINMVNISNKNEYFSCVYLIKLYASKISECWSHNAPARAYLSDLDSRGSSVNVSALKSKGSTSWRSSIRSLSVLLLALVYLDVAVNGGKNVYLLFYCLYGSVYGLMKKSQDYKQSEF